MKDVQTLLANFGILSCVMKRREARKRFMPNGMGGKTEYFCKADYELIIGGESRERYMSEIGFLTDEKNEKYQLWASDKAPRMSQRFVSKVSEISYVGKEAVFDTTQKDRNAVIFNGIVTGQCGEQPLPPYGSCLLGSVNLTRFVREPFTEQARFDWDEYREVVRVFTRMLDNVVEINGLPLQQQRQESRANVGTAWASWTGLHHHVAGTQVRFEPVDQVHRGRRARDGAGGLGSGAGTGTRERPRADHE